MMTAKENVCVDFDGVLNEYEGWKGEDAGCQTPAADGS